MSAPPTDARPAPGAEPTPEPSPPLAGRTRLREHVSSRRDRVLFAIAGFVVTIAIARTATGILHAKGAGANGGMVIAGVHVHHFVFGIAILLMASFGWLMLAGIDDERRLWFRITAIAYGVGAGLLLDEFALWLNLQDVYWQHRGRQSIEAIGGFLAILLLAIFTRPYRQAVRKARRDRRTRRTD
jgi:hypothetical protein